MELQSTSNYDFKYSQIHYNDHIIDNIDRKNKYLDSPESYNTNSVVIQNFSDDQEFSQSVETKYDFSRKYHKLLKLVTTTFLNINFKGWIPKLMSSITKDDQIKEFQSSSKKILKWVLLRDKTANSFELQVPLLSSSNQILVSEQSFLKANVIYLPPITTTPT